MDKPSKSIFTIYRDAHKSSRGEIKAKILFHKGRSVSFTKNKTTRISNLEEFFKNKGQDYTAGYLSKFGEYASLPEHIGDLIVDYFKLKSRRKLESLTYKAATNTWNKYFRK